MTPQDLQAYLSALASTLTVGVVIPLLILAMMVFAIWRLLARAQQDEAFDIAEILRDDNSGKVSMTQVLKMGAWAATTFVMVVTVFALPNLLFEVYVSYLGTWGATSLGVEFLKRKYPAPPP